MNKESLIILLVAGIAMSLLAGCNDGSNTPTAPVLTTTITTQLSIAGGVQPWANALVQGALASEPPPCDQSTDEYCLLSFAYGSQETGVQSVSTDAMPADWNIGASDPYGSTCPAGSTWYGNLTPIEGATLVCGQLSLGQVVVSPQQCTVLTGKGGVIEGNNCPSTIRLTLPSPSLPTAHALAVGTYNDEGKSEASNSITASSSTSITVPTPTIYGNSAVVIVDPATNTVLGAGLFTKNVKSVICPPGESCN